MKLVELLLEEVEAPRVIEGNVMVPKDALTLNYYNTIVTGNFSLSMNRNIRSLIGSPIEVGFFDCSFTQIHSLEGCPRISEGINCYGTRIKSLKNIHRYIIRISKVLRIGNTLESSILGLLKIRELGKIEIYNAERSPTPLTHALAIINKYRKTGDVHLAQEEMLEAGLKEFAYL